MGILARLYEKLLPESSRAPQPILFSASYADPNPIGSNRIVATVARSLRAAGEHVEILTHVNDGTWRGPRPTRSDASLFGVAYTRVELEGVTYHVTDLPGCWTERVSSPRDWDDAVAWGENVLRALRPRLLHQHYWQNTRWMLDAAHRLGIPTVYSFYDYGIGCLRTMLVMGDDRLCDAIVEGAKCTRCVISGRNLVGRLNECAVRVPGLRGAIDRFGFGRERNGWLARRGGSRLPVATQVAHTRQRAGEELRRLDAAIVPSPFAMKFLQQFGLDAGRVHVFPWFHNRRDAIPPMPSQDGGLRLGFVGRMQQDKGLHVLLQALSRVDTARPVELLVAAAIDNEYARRWQARYPTHADKNPVIWKGWLSGESVSKMLAEVHAVVVPSLWYDNTPVALIEAVAHGRPAIVTDVESMTHIVRHEQNGLTFPMGDVEALAAAISRLASNPELVLDFARKLPEMDSPESYARKLREIYRSIPNAASEPPSLLAGR